MVRIKEVAGDGGMGALMVFRDRAGWMGVQTFEMLSFSVKTASPDGQTPLSRNAFLPPGKPKQKAVHQLDNCLQLGAALLAGLQTTTLERD